MSRFRRILLVFGTWVAVTAGASAVAWRSVMFVTAQLTDQLARPLNFASPGQAPQLAAPRSLASGATIDPTSPMMLDSSGTDTSSSSSVPAKTAPPAGAGGTTLLARQDDAAAPRVSAGLGGGQPAQTATAAATRLSQTIAAQGGITTVGCRGDQIQLISASPNPDYRVSLNGGDSPGRRLEVRYAKASNPEHQSSVSATCQGGKPVWHVEESGSD